MTDVILKRQRMPWLWPDLLFRWTPQGREHDRCLKIIHDFTGKVIQDRMNDFEADRIVGKRAAFLGEYQKSNSFAKQIHFTAFLSKHRSSSETETRRKL